MKEDTVDVGSLLEDLENRINKRAKRDLKMEMTLDLAFDLQCGLQTAAEEIQRREAPKHIAWTFEKQLLQSPKFLKQCLSEIEKDSPGNAEKIGYRIGKREVKKIIKDLNVQNMIVNT